MQYPDESVNCQVYPPSFWLSFSRFFNCECSNQRSVESIDQDFRPGRTQASFFVCLGVLHLWSKPLASFAVCIRACNALVVSVLPNVSGDFFNRWPSSRYLKTPCYVSTNWVDRRQPVDRISSLRYTAPKVIVSLFPREHLVTLKPPLPWRP